MGHYAEPFISRGCNFHPPPQLQLFLCPTSPQWVFKTLCPALPPAPRVHPSCPIPLSMQEEPALPEQGTELHPAHFHLQSQQNGYRLPSTTGFTGLAGGCQTVTAQFLPCSQHKPGQPPPSCSPLSLPGGPLLQGRYCTSMALAAPHAQRPVTTLCLSLCLKATAELWEIWFSWVLSCPCHSCILERVK